MRIYVVLAALLWLAVPAEAQQARSIQDCERLTDWNAYNNCLASFGPRRGQRLVRGQPDAQDPESRVYGRGGRQQGRAIAARRATPGLQVQRVQGGRVRATLDISAPVRARRR